MINATSSSMLKHDPSKFDAKFGWFGGATSDENIFISQNERSPWIQFHISPTPISAIVVINRKDDFGEKFRNIEVRGGLDPNFLNNGVIGWFTGPGVTGGSHYIEFKRATEVEYLTLQMMGWDNLQMNGVKVIVGRLYEKGPDGLLYKCYPGNFTFYEAQAKCEDDDARITIVENIITRK